MRHRVKVGLLAFALLLLATVALAAATVTVTGQGGSERDALHNAMRTAIEQEIGVLVDSQTYVDNYRVISDKIYTNTEGYITDYQVLKKDKVNGIHTVTIKATVARELLNTDLMSNLQKKRLVQTNMLDPRIGVIVMDSNGSENAALENVLITGLQGNGFSRIVDMNQISASVKQRIATAVYNGDEGLAQMMRSSLNADYLVTGKIDRTSQGLPLPEAVPFLDKLRNVSITVAVRMLNANTGEILYAGAFQGQAFNFESKAEDEAVRKATKNIVSELANSALKTAANPEQHITLVVSGGKLGSMTQAYERVNAIPGVNRVYTRTAQDGNLQIDVDYNGTAYDLAQALERDGIAIKEMSSAYIRI